MLNLQKSVRLILLSTLLAAPSISLAKFTQEYQKTVPANMALLGAETYVTMPLDRLAKPQIPFVDLELAQEDGYEVNASGLTAKGASDLLSLYGYAGRLSGEPATAYTTGQITVYVGGYGGDGMGVNLGDGRSTILGKYRVKGGARTVKVRMVDNHANGAASLGEAIRESIAGNILDYELPYGAYKSLAVVTTGTQMANGEDRALIVAEDPLRFAHYILNIAAQNEGGQLGQEDQIRVNEAMKKIADALPKPAGMDLRGKSRQERFLIGINEAMDRQAIQYGYAWAHKIYHGATSTSNAAVDGRMIDFGTLSFFPGYAHVQILSDEGPNGNPDVFIRDLWQNVWNGYRVSLPPDLWEVLPTEQAFYQRFLNTYQRTRRSELVRMAGVFNEIQFKLLKKPEAKGLGEILLQIAEAGHDKTIELWHRPMEEVQMPPGRYDLEKILNALASANLDSTTALSAAITHLLPEADLRDSLVTSYQKVFLLQRTMISALGVSAASEAKYRIGAAKMRNRAMDLLIKNPQNRAALVKVENEFNKTKNSHLVQDFIQSRVDLSRREFRDTPPLTVVLSEKRLPSGDRVREIFDAKSGVYRNVSIPLHKTQSTPAWCESKLTQMALSN